MKEKKTPFHTHNTNAIISKSLKAAENSIKETPIHQIPPNYRRPKTHQISFAETLLFTVKIAAKQNPTH